MTASLYVSHGSPMILVEDSPAAGFLRGLGDSLPRPTAILAVSAHWPTRTPALTVAEPLDTIHDFYGFPEALYGFRYAPPTAGAVARQAHGLLAQAGLAPQLEDSRGLDHGAWVPLLLGWPQADIPVAALSVQPHLGPDHHYAVGQALRPLREQGVLILASGALTHNLRAYFTEGRDDGAAVPWASDFADWMADRVMAGDRAALLDYRAQAPFAVRNHPTDEHLLPLFVALGAGAAGPGTVLHRSLDRGVLAMDAYGL